MGGIQTFEWISLYPDFMDKAISITGTPKQTAYDLILWRTELELLERAGGSRDAIKQIAAINDLHLRTPDWIAKNVTDVDKTLADHVKALDRLDPFDHMSQLRAMIAHDITPDFHPPLKPKMFIAVALQDHMVNPGPAREFARVHGTEVLTLSGDCGHIAPGCERETLKREVSRFLGR
jgi:homoserine O-acetyltransferase